MRWERLRSPRHANCWPTYLFAVLVAVMSLGAPAAGAQEWIYSARKGDNLWVLAEDFLVSMRHWREFRALNNVPYPRRMQPGTRIRFPVEWLRVQPVSALVTAISGGAKATGVSGELSPLAAGQELSSGQRVVTGPGASAVLRFADGSTMLVRPGSDIRMDDLGLYGRRAMVDTRARLQRGRVEVEVEGPDPGRPANRMEITTPSASALVRGTRFRAMSEEKATRTEVVTGGVRVANAAGRVDLGAGTGTVVRAGEPPLPPRELLPAPGLDTVPTLIERRQIRLRFAEVEGAVGYSAQIATVDAVPVLLVDVASSTPRLPLPDLPDGRYELRVRAVDELGLEGFEARRVFELNARPEPPATLEPRPGRTVRVLRPAFRWSEPADAVAYRIQLATDDGFAHMIIDRADLTGTTLEPANDLAAGPYRWRVATIDASGEQGPFGDTQAFTLRPAPPAPGEVEADIGDEEVLLRWRLAQPDQSYEVELSASEDFSGETQLEATVEPQLIVPTPEHDIWFRVRIVDTDGYRGPFGTPQFIQAPHSAPWWLLAIPLLILIL